jgi:flagellar hook-length control protein FliK
MMMGSAMALLTGMAPAPAASGAQGEAAAPQGMDFLVALLAATPVAPVDPAVAGLPSQPAAQQPGEESTDVTASADLAALIAAMQAVVTTAPAGNAPAAVASEQDGEGGAAPAAAADMLARTAAQLLAQLEQANAAAEQVAGTVADAQAPGVARNAGLHQMLRALSQRLEAPEPVPSNAAADTGKVGNPAQAFAVPPMLAEAVTRAPETVAVAVTGAQRADMNQLSAENQPQTSMQPQAQLQVAPQGPSQQSATAAGDLTLHTPVGTPRWADELGSRMVLMSVRGQHEGSLNLTPEHLGPLEVRVSVNQGTANVWFGSQHADTRAALTEALPRLRELFADAGLMLGHAGVSQEAPRQAPRDSEAARLAGAARGNAGEEPTAAIPAITRRIALGLVDTYV